MDTVDGKWKYAAIIVTILLILETAFVFWCYDMGAKEENMRTLCVVDVCGSVQNTASFTFDRSSNVCACYDREGTMLKQKAMGG